MGLQEERSEPLGHQQCSMLQDKWLGTWPLRIKDYGTGVPGRPSRAHYSQAYTDPFLCSALSPVSRFFWSGSTLPLYHLLPLPLSFRSFSLSLSLLCLSLSLWQMKASPQLPLTLSFSRSLSRSVLCPLPLSISSHLIILNSVSESTCFLFRLSRGRWTLWFSEKFYTRRDSSHIHTHTHTHSRTHTLTLHTTTHSHTQTHAHTTQSMCTHKHRHTRTFSYTAHGQPLSVS